MNLYDKISENLRFIIFLAKKSLYVDYIMDSFLSLPMIWYVKSFYI